MQDPEPEKTLQAIPHSLGFGYGSQSFTVLHRSGYTASMLALVNSAPDGVSSKYFASKNFKKK